MCLYSNILFQPNLVVVPVLKTFFSVKEVVDPDTSYRRKVYESVYEHYEYPEGELVLPREGFNALDYPDEQYMFRITHGHLHSTFTTRFCYRNFRLTKVCYAVGITAIGNFDSDPPAGKGEHITSMGLYIPTEKDYEKHFSFQEVVKTTLRLKKTAVQEYQESWRKYLKDNDISKANNGGPLHDYIFDEAEYADLADVRSEVA